MISGDVMKCVFSVLADDGYTFIIENDKVCFCDDGNIKTLNVDRKSCFNTLVSLFSLKESWKASECENPLYKIVFYNGDKNEEFLFDLVAPFNFSLFTGYISRLVGRSI